MPTTQDTDQPPANLSAEMEDPRGETIRGLRELADWLEAHPDAPIPSTPTLLAPICGNDDTRGEQEVRRVADAIGQPVVADDHNIEVSAGFGRYVSYRCYYIWATQTARYEAHSSYWNAVQPDGGEPR